MRQLAFSVACGLAVGLVILSAPWHVKSRNTGALLYIGWALVGNLIYLVNSIVWNGNISNPSPVWCDIATKLIIGLNVALPCASLCIQRRLYIISRVSQIGPTYAQRREIYIDLSIGLGFPILIMILHYVVQGHRFDIYEDYGCWPTIYLSWLAYFLVLIWPTVISSISLVLAGFTFCNLRRQRAALNELLMSQRPAISVNRYVRLMALVSVEMVIVFPMSIVILVHNSSLGLNPWISWENTHYNFGRISYVTNFLLNTQPKSSIVIFELARWCMPLAGLLFFVFFGLASESRKQYQQAFNAIERVMGVPSAMLPHQHRKDTPGQGPSRRDTFVWMENGLPYDDLSARSLTTPNTPPSHVPCTPLTSTSPTSSDEASKIGRLDSISSSRSGKTMRSTQNADDATICGVLTSLKRADSIDKPLPEIPFQGFTGPIVTAADLEAQVQIIGSRSSARPVSITNSMLS